MPYFLGGGALNTNNLTDDGMFYSTTKGSVTHAHVDQACTPSMQATITGDKRWRLWLGSKLQDRLRDLQAGGYEGVPMSTQEAPFEDVVRAGETLVFSAMLRHEVKVVGTAEGWQDRSIALSFYFGHPHALFLQDTFWAELTTDGIYKPCRHIWSRPKVLQ